MSIKGIAKEMARQLMETKEYKGMMKRKRELYAHPKLGTPLKNYETKQIQIAKMNISPEKKQSLMSSLNKEYQTLLAANEMKDYHAAIKGFQKRTFTLFEELNMEISKALNQ